MPCPCHPPRSLRSPLAGFETAPFGRSKRFQRLLVSERGRKKQPPCALTKLDLLCATTLNLPPSPATLVMECSSLVMRGCHVMLRGGDDSGRAEERFTEWETTDNSGMESLRAPQASSNAVLWRSEDPSQQSQIRTSLLAQDLSLGDDDGTLQMSDLSSFRTYSLSDSDLHDGVSQSFSTSSAQNQALASARQIAIKKAQSSRKVADPGLAITAD
eukprot:2184936-Rhodomonas_salina.1